MGVGAVWGVAAAVQETRDTCETSVHPSPAWVATYLGHYLPGSLPAQVPTCRGPSPPWVLHLLGPYLPRTLRVQVPICLGSSPAQVPHLECPLPASCCLSLGYPEVSLPFSTPRAPEGSVVCTTSLGLHRPGVVQTRDPTRRNRTGRPPRAPASVKMGRFSLRRRLREAGNRANSPAQKAWGKHRLPAGDPGFLLVFLWGSTWLRC